jgi:hypothetical protein
MEARNDENFWKPKPIEDFAKAQRINGPQSLETLTGAAANLWENDEDFDRFLFGHIK